MCYYNKQSFEAFKAFSKFPMQKSLFIFPLKHLELPSMMMSISKGLSFDTNVSNFVNFDHHSALVSDPPIVLAQWCVVFHARLPWACSIQVRCCLHGSTRVYTVLLCTCSQRKCICMCVLQLSTGSFFFFLQWSVPSLCLYTSNACPHVCS